MKEEEQKVEGLSPKKHTDLWWNKKRISDILAEIEGRDPDSPNDFNTLTTHKRSAKDIHNDDLDNYYKEMGTKKMMQFINEEF